MNARVLEADGQVGPALATGDDAATGPVDTGEVNVPQPGQVLPIGHLPVDANDDLGDPRINHGHRFLPARGIFREHQTGAPTIHVVNRIAARDLGNTTDGLRGHRGVDTHCDRSSDCLRRVAEIRSTGKQQVEGDVHSARSVQSCSRAVGGQVNVGKPPVGLGPTLQCGKLFIGEGRDQVPVLTVAHDAPSARVGRRVATPPRAGGDPHDAGVIRGCGDDERIVAVSDDDGVRMGRRTLAKALFHRADLTDAIKLVAREIQVDENVGLYISGDRRHMHFVDLEGSARGILSPHERSDDA